MIAYPFMKRIVVDLRQTKKTQKTVILPFSEFIGLFFRSGFFRRLEQNRNSV